MNGNIFFTADTHFGHTNVIKYCQRPFSSVQEMDDVLIENWNKTVSKTDRIYHLGDFCFHTSQMAKKYFHALNGCKFLVKGNHDRTPATKLPWVEIYDTKEIKIDDQPVWLSHYAHRVWNKSHHGSIHLYGHSHGGIPPFGKSFDVGVDCWDYTPVSWDLVLKTVEKFIMMDNTVKKTDHHTDNIWRGLEFLDK
jgi:calcineurin-like phosphoesterase family protein